MVQRYLLIGLTLAVVFACKKDTIDISDADPSVKTPMTKFLFINNLGFRKDSTSHGVNDTVLSGVCLYLKYFDKKANMSHLDHTCYNRNFQSDNFPLADSIIYSQYEATIGCKFAYEIELVWKNSSTFKTTRNIKYNLASYPSSDTIKIEKDTLIKFTWPDDTASGRFIKTYQYP